MMAKAGATHVVVMERSHRTVKCVVKAGRDHGVKVMGGQHGRTLHDRIGPNGWKTWAATM